MADEPELSAFGGPAEPIALEAKFQIGDHVLSNPTTPETGIVGTIIGIKSIPQVDGPDENTYLIEYDDGGGEKAWWPELSLTSTAPEVGLPLPDNPPPDEEG